jgi:hypothetical protein
MTDLRRRVGDLSQLVSTREVRLGDGNEDGVRAIDVRVTGGLSSLVLADRGLDLGPTWAAGHQVSWQSPTGIVAPGHFDESNWLRSFHGGLLTTCGLQNVGPACVDEGVAYGIHGRVSNIPARSVTHGVVVDDGRLVAEVTGEVRETDVYGPDLVLHRRLRFPMGEPTVIIRDEVENRGFAPAALLLLYHVNVGHPVVADDAVLLAPDADVVPRDAPAAALLADHARFQPPTDGFGQLVYEHRLRGAPVDGQAWAAVANPGYGPTGGIAVAVHWDPAQLPRLWQWRMLAPGMYLTGIEPATCGVLGRAAERESGGLLMLEPGERRTFDVRISVILGPAVEQLVREHMAQGASR